MTASPGNAVHSSRHDQNFASLHAGASLPGHVLDVVVLTADAGFLATLREASAPEHAIWHAPSADAAVDLLVGGRCSILIADLGSLRGDAAALLDRLHAQFPELVLMATGRRDEEGAVASLVSSGLIYRFLHKPVSPARAALFITAATRRYHELRNLEPIGMTTVRTMAARPHIGKLAAGLALLVMAIIGLLVWRSRDRPAPIAVQQSSVEAPTAREQIADRLARAQIAYATGRFFEPRGDNALDYFRAVLALQPDQPEATAGVARVVAVLEARAVEALQARNAPRGVAALMALQRAQPDHPRLEAFRTELIGISRSAAATATASAAVPRASIPNELAHEDTNPAAAALRRQPDEADRPRSVTARKASAEAKALATPADALESSVSLAPGTEDLQRVVQLRERGALIAPEGDNAYEALAAIRSAFPEADEVRAEQQRLAFALLESTRTALAAGDVDDAATFLTRADSLVPGMATTRALQQQLADAQAQRDFANNIVQAAALKRVREAAAVYPREAQREGVEGWVDVEFTIAPDGSTRDLVVRDAQNREIFEKSALDSVRRWRFAPVIRNGAAVPQRANLRVRFVLR